jgi:hypothetical protein
MHMGDGEADARMRRRQRRRRMREPNVARRLGARRRRAMRPAIKAVLVTGRSLARRAHGVWHTKVCRTFAGGRSRRAGGARLA